MTSPPLFVAAYLVGGALVVFTLLRFERRQRQNSHVRSRSVQGPWWEAALMVAGLILLGYATYETTL